MTNPVLSAPLDLITTAVLDLLNASGRKVWDGAYGGSPTAPAYPYGILYRLPGGSSDDTPDLGDTRQTVTAVWQVTTVSKLRNQCERTAQMFHDRLVGRTRPPGGPWQYAHDLAMPDGWVCTRRAPDPAMPGIDRVGNEPNAVYSLPARYYLTLTPA